MVHDSSVWFNDLSAQQRLDKQRLGECGVSKHQANHRTMQGDAVPVVREENTSTGVKLFFQLPLDLKDTCS